MVTLTLLEERLGMKGNLIRRAIKAGIYPEAYDQAVAAFILKVIEKMGPPAPYLCHKQPLTFLYAKYLGFLFPKAKFVHILRDGRAVTSSLIERGFNPVFTKENALNGLKQWNQTVTLMLRQCQELGVDRCYTIIYEKLVMQPEIETRRLFEFLGIPWDPVVTRHETKLKTITNPNPYEPSTRQFMKKIHTKSVDSWAGPKAVLNETVLKNITAACTLLDTLGYTALGFPPDYTKMNSTVPVTK
ncbi:protein-tyrosine sulfotransferase [Clonorchis sinensis]|uniref:Protein-tyrosine sulfotransferase n=1 Tax=Clonorchis sinensis TaxID=79923 RepID=G7YGK9_CLOSI|nr:protein-tyrosine sulfotransferase [Clonorchis sinensis]